MTSTAWPSPPAWSRFHAALKTRSGFERIWRITAYVIISLGALVMLFPFLWMVSTSLKPLSQVYAWPPVWIPWPPRWKNYVEALTILPFHLYFRNTMVIVTADVIGDVLVSSLVGFAFARLRARGKEFLFLLLLSTLMLPQQVTLIPHYVIFKTLGWIDTLLPLIVPVWLGGAAFHIFLMRQFFMGLPMDLDDAAKLDGCSPFGIWWRIAVPLSKPAMATIGIFAFIAHWNEFLGPLIYLHSNYNRTLALALRFFQTQYGTDMHYLMAASVVMLMPVLIVFFSAQKIFVKGIAFTGLTGG